MNLKKDTTMTTLIRLGARIRAARKAAGFKTAKAFLKKYKVPASTYSQHESGARTPEDERLKFYTQVFGVDFNWLKTGKGQPFKKITPFKKETLAEESIHLRRAEHINEELLAKILTRFMKTHAIKLSSKAIKSIADKSAETYKKQAFFVYNKNKC
jgi:transcriptional regulator with XRE-family HTH domain